jgi:exodeoxyribonuclease-5
VLRNHLHNFVVCAFTGKAANVLRRKGVPASTIHSLIYRAEEATWVDEKGRRQTGTAFRLKPPKDVPGEGFLVDEASMVGRRIYDDLCSLGRPVIFVGDHGQLGPVADADFGVMTRPDVILQTVHRNAGEIAWFADFVRQGNTPSDWQRHRLCTGRAVRIHKFEELGKALDRDPDQIICAYNETRVMLNESYREFRGYPADRPVAGDSVICLQNDYRLGLFNGMQGKIVTVVADEMVFRADGTDYRLRFIPEAFHSLRKLDYQRERLPFDYAYVVTCHKAQGDEWDDVLVLEQRCSRWDHARWAYTAASRARRRLWWVRL